ncbi:MAG: 3-deoxy-manno-octulosonate cytidylyltransferase [Bdellovibrio sp.]|nr:MAG: 3-deoxy-manno-octulosonate cytidylyltransferase [Bdellovibrio sp.]
MKILSVIPARYGSSRFPGKPLAKIQGREMILHVADRVAGCRLLDQVLVATDDQRIADVVEKAGHRAVMTHDRHASGTDRIHEAIQQLNLEDQDIVVNVQGDEPSTEAAWIESLIRPLIANTALPMSTLAHEISGEEMESPHAVKVLTNRHSQAIYFSRFPIPFSRMKIADFKRPIVYKHMGFYAYRKFFLDSFCQRPVEDIERAEGLEQLRALAMGSAIHVQVIEGRSQGVDTPDDLARMNEAWAAPRVKIWSSKR